jgi:hypothetical protein
MFRGPVFGAMYGCYLRSRKDATEFWKAVRDETGEKPDCPDRKLARWLLSSFVNVGLGSRIPEARRASQREFYVRSIHAWNAWRKGERTDLKYFPKATVPSFS